MKLLCLCLLGITVLVKLLVPTLANPDGFLSISCGASNNQTDDAERLWVPDYPFIKVKSRQNETIRDLDLYLPYRSMAYFTDLSQKKYCYLLPVNRGDHYLVRTKFNYDEELQSRLSLASMFDLLLGGVKWTELSLQFNNISIASSEIIFAAKSDRLSLCLARNSRTEPNRYVFISTIELRPLDSGMYESETIDFDKNTLVKIDRYNFGGETINYRNQSDPYDRLWTGYTFKHLPDISDSNNFDTGLQNRVPQIVLRTAVSAYGTGQMDISNAFSSLKQGSYVFYSYFCNIHRQALSLQVRINLKASTDWISFENDRKCKQRDVPFNLRIHSNITVVLVSDDSASGPFINGAELYRILDVQNTQLEDVLAVREIADAINVPDDWSGADPCLPAGYSSTGITCSKDDPPRVIIIDLTNMGLVGNIPASITKLTALTQLLLGNNSLSGTIPDLSQLRSLTKLYLQNNNLTGTVPRGLVKRGLELRVDPEIKFPAHKRKSWTIPISVGCSVLLVLVVICTAFIWRHRHRSQPCTKDHSAPKAQHASADVENRSEYRMLAIEYVEQEIKVATKDYSQVIGKGSFGSVFYGRISNSDVAIKVLSDDSSQGESEFNTELIVLSRIHHKNLVNLVGYCRQPVIALVYEYMECGSLKDHLYGITKMKKPLNWHSRLNIALQAAEGLLYLHHECNPPIIHRDIKSNNILLDGKMCAKIGDFGLSKMLESSKSYVGTIVKGTIGYLDPEYFETSTLTEKSDVYSFGVVLLEIISGISPKDGIVESARKLLSCGRLVDLVDTSLGGRYNLASVWRVADVAYGCTEPKSINRPKMSVVVKELQEAAALPEEDVNRFGNIFNTPSIQGDLPCAR